MSNKLFLEKAFNIFNIKDKSWIDLIDQKINFEKEKLCCYLANVFHETKCLTKLEEGFKYSTEALKLDKRFSKEDALKYGYIGDGKTGKYIQEPNQEMIANIKYNRKELGNIDFGDGYKYRGRGFFQLTGKYNYQKCGEYLKIDLINNPDLILKKEIAIDTSLWFWKANNLDKIFIEEGHIAVRKAINGGDNGMEDYKQKFEKLFLC